MDSSLRTMAREQSSQDLWTSWLDGWSSHGPVTDLGVEPTSTTISNISLRLDQKVNGLFDNEYAGMMDDFAGDNMDITLDKNILMGKKNDMEIEGGEVVDILEALGSTFPGDDFLNSFIDLSNFADIQETESKPDFSLAEPVISFDLPGLDVNLTAESGTSGLVVPEIEEKVVPAECGKKRKFSETGEEEGLAAADLDHDYITKIPRMSKVVVNPQDEIVEEKGKAPEKKYVERRIKNNIASKRSRYIRKMKFVEMESEADRLIQENQKMRLKIEEMETLAKEMKSALINKLAEKK